MRSIQDFALTFIANRDWDRSWVSDLHIVLRKGDGNFLTLYESMGEEAKMAPQEVIQRGTALYYWFCTLNLVDDMMDGDCDYLDPKEQPLAILALTNLVDHVLSHSSVSPAARIEATRAMGSCISGQYQESLRGVRSLLEYKEVGHAIAGLQFKAYFHLFLDGTSFDFNPPNAALLYGNAAHVLADLSKKDPRLLQLPDPKEAVEWGLSCAQLAQGFDLSPSFKERLEFTEAAIVETAKELL